MVLLLILVGAQGSFLVDLCGPYRVFGCMHGNRPIYYISTQALDIRILKPVKNVFDVFGNDNMIYE